MGRGAQNTGQDQGQGQGYGYRANNAGGVPNQLPNLGGVRPEELIQQFRAFGRELPSFGGYNPAGRFRPRANASAMTPEGALPITAASGPASTQGSPVAPTPSGVNPASPGNFAGAAPTPGGPAEGGVPPGPGGSPQGPADPGALQQRLVQALRMRNSG